MHMFATVSLGGLSPHDASFGFFQSPLLEGIALIFMLLASCNFALYFIALRKGNWRTLWNDPEMRATIGVLLGGGVLVALLLWAKGVYGPLEALRYGCFRWSQWPPPPVCHDRLPDVAGVCPGADAVFIRGGHQCGLYRGRHQDDAHADLVPTSPARNDPPGASPRGAAGGGGRQGD